jgi:hypothetical protein
MSTRYRKIIFLGSKDRPVSRADNLAAICESITVVRAVPSDFVFDCRAAEVPSDE